MPECAVGKVSVRQSKVGVVEHVIALDTKLDNLALVPRPVVEVLGELGIGLDQARAMVLIASDISKGAKRLIYESGIVKPLRFDFRRAHPGIDALERSSLHGHIRAAIKHRACRAPGRIRNSAPIRNVIWKALGESLDAADLPTRSHDVQQLVTT